MKKRVITENQGMSMSTGSERNYVRPVVSIILAIALGVFLYTFGSKGPTWKQVKPHHIATNVSR